jgi:hypothetical protein
MLNQQGGLPHCKSPRSMFRKTSSAGFVLVHAYVIFIEMGCRSRRSGCYKPVFRAALNREMEERVSLPFDFPVPLAVGRRFGKH